MLKTPDPSTRLFARRQHGRTHLMMPQTAPDRSNADAESGARPDGFWSAGQISVDRPEPGPRREVRFYQLDSLRGLAAMTVVFLHFENILVSNDAVSQLKPSQFWLLQLASPLTSGNRAVGFFFVLSGFVLMLPFLKEPRPSYGIFVLRRTLRIYGPYLAGLVIAMAGAAMWPGPRNFAEWGDGPWVHAPTLIDVLRYVFLVPGLPVKFNPVFWTLVTEMYVAFVFPLLAWLVLRLPAALVIALALVLSITARVAVRYDAPLDVLNLEFAGMFLCGMLLARHLSKAGRWFSDLRLSLRVLLALLALGSYVLAGLLSHAVDWVVTCASVLFIVIAMYSSTAGRLLNGVALRLLGRVSYSLYLVHVPVLMVLAIALRGRVSPFLLLALYLAGAFLCTGIFYLLVERPFTVWSRSVAHVQVSES